MKVQKFRRGQIWWYKTGVSFDGTTYNEGKPRPIIIISNELANANSNCLLGVPCTTQEKKDMPTHLKFTIDNTPNTALAENLMSINIEKLTGYIGTVDKELMEKLEYTVAIALGIDRFLPNAMNDMKIVFHRLSNIEESIQDNNDSANKLPNILAKSPAGRKPKYSKDDMIRFINDYENHDKEFMLKKYNLKDSRALQQKAYMFRKQIKEIV